MGPARRAALRTRTFLDARVEIDALTESFPHDRVVGYDRDDRRVINTSVWHHDPHGEGRGGAGR